MYIYLRLTACRRVSVHAIEDVLRQRDVSVRECHRVLQKWSPLLLSFALLCSSRECLGKIIVVAYMYRNGSKEGGSRTMEDSATTIRGPCTCAKQRLAGFSSPLTLFVPSLSW